MYDISYVYWARPISRPQPAREAVRAPDDRPDAAVPDGTRSSRRTERGRRADDEEVARRAVRHADAGRTGSRALWGRPRPATARATRRFSNHSGLSRRRRQVTSHIGVEQSPPRLRSSRPPPRSVRCTLAVWRAIPLPGCRRRPGAPLLTPDEDTGAALDEIRLILDPDPELSSSEGQPRPEPRSRSDDMAWADYALGWSGWRAPSWLWGLVVLAVLVTVLVVIVATAQPPGR